MTSHDVAAWIAATDARVAKLRAANEAVLLFHGGGMWMQSDADRWLAITGRPEATSRVLCDFIRQTLKETE